MTPGGVTAGFQTGSLVQRPAPDDVALDDSCADVQCVTADRVVTSRFDGTQLCHALCHQPCTQKLFQALTVQYVQ